MTHQSGPGPSSLKLAALSAYSYHLDSPPFTGTAGPLGEASDDYEKLSSSLRDAASNLVDEESSPILSGDQTPAALVRTSGQRERVPTSGSSRQQQSSQVMQDGLKERDEAYARTQHDDDDGDGDVPRWDLDDPRHLQQQHHAQPHPALQQQQNYNHNRHQSQDHNRSTVNDGSSGHLLSNSLSPPPFSSSALGPLANASNAALTARPLERSARTPLISDGNGHRRRPSSRPAFTQISDSNSTSNEETSSAIADGDADADADESPFEAEADGDDTAFVVRNSTGNVNGTTNKVPTQSQTKEQYRFPRHRLPTRMRNETKIPLVIVACGSFSPPTYLHLRIFEMAKDQVMESGKYELLGGYYSPVSDYYKKEGLAKATHRVRMCELAVEKTSTWLMVDAWESLQDEYQRTAVVLDHFDEEINGGPEGGVKLSSGSRRKIRIMLLAGGDLIQSMGEPGVWADVDLNHILGKYGCMIVERTGADVWSFLLSHDLLWRYRRNLKIVKQTIFNDISSSKVRLFVRRGQSIKYLLPNSVIHYIERHKLYRLPKELDTEPPDADNQHLDFT